MQRTPEQEASPTLRPPDPRLVAEMDSFGKKLTEKGTFEPMGGKDAKMEVKNFFGIGAYPVGKLLEFIINNNVLDLKFNSAGGREHAFDRKEVLECFGGIARNLKRWTEFGFKYPNAKVFKETVLTTRIGLGSDPRASFIRDPSPARKKGKLSQARRQQAEEQGDYDQMSLTDADRADLEEALRCQIPRRRSKAGIQEPVLDFAETQEELLKRRILSNIPQFDEETLAKLSRVGRRELDALYSKISDAIGSEEVIFIGDKDVNPALVKRYGADFDITAAVMFVSMFRQREIPQFDRRLPRLTYQEMCLGYLLCLQYFDDKKLKEKGLENLKQLFLNVEKAVTKAMNKWDTRPKLGV